LLIDRAVMSACSVGCHVLRDESASVTALSNLSDFRDVGVVAQASR
jgi:16S rRNA U1498 N3-methylase RsmE